jgi:hypothetical protein
MNLAAHNVPLLLLSRMLLLLLLLLEATSMGKPHPSSMARESCVTSSSHASEPSASRRVQSARKRHQIAVGKDTHL